MSSIHEILEQYWGYKAFRPLQEDIITSVLDGKDTLALLPTGGGKSICFQVPAMAKEGLCIVVSPLIALMKDQVENLEKRGIRAKAIYSGMSYREINLTLDNCIHGDFKFLYLSPERLKSEMVRGRIQQMNVNLLAVDEAHCISQWGYDFRPEYLQIAEIRELLPDVPVMALTASATPEVVKDIQQQLKFPKPNVFIKSFTRANVSYVVNQTEDKQNRLLQVLSKVKGTALVYVRNRRKTQELAKLLSFNRERADYYHAGLPHELRVKKQEEWISNKTRVMVCTNAFGMGIDKPDVRLVVHYEVPESLESYYQEAGRAGRDEKRSYAVLLFNKPDEHEALERFEMGFPAEQDIRRVYQALCNYYAIPVGANPDRAFDFNISDFSGRFNLLPTLVYPSLKVLEQCDILSLSENFYEPSKLKFLLNHELLYKFQVEHETYDNFVKLLLRSYGGLFDQYMTISEKLIGVRGKLDERLVREYLDKLHKLQIVDYQPQKDQPQITFLQMRAAAEHLDFARALLKKRKEVAKNKLDAMLDYANNSTVCRSRRLVAYFDEYGAEDCGICDVCLQRKKMEMNAQEFEELVAQIRAQLVAAPLHVDLLAAALPLVKPEKTLEAVRFLLDNDKLRYNSSRQLEWNN